MPSPRRVFWEPNPGPQTKFLACPVGEILYGGAKGGGKSDAIGPKAVKHVKMYGQHATVLILRETSKQLRDLMKRVKPHCLREGARFNKTEATWTFPSGAQIIFGHLTDGCDPYWGQEYTMIVVDEVTRCIASEVEYLELLGSLRSSHGIPCQVVLTTNPGGVGHNWVKARFMNVPPLAEQVQTLVDPVTKEKVDLARVFIPARLKDNPKLPASYGALLAQLPDAERAAYLDGDWDAFTGRVFKLLPGIHTWTWEQFKERTGHDRPPLAWRRYRSYDHGFARPGACYWYAVDEHNRAFVYREYYTVAKDGKGQVVPNEGAKLEPRAVAKNIAEKSEGETYAASWTGPDLFYEVRQDQAGGQKIATHFQAEKVNFTAWTASPGSRRAGKLAFIQRLAYPKKADGSPDGWPLLIFITEECPHALRTIPALERDDHDPELWDTDGEDHSADSIMGFCKMKPLPTIIAAPAGPKWMEAEMPGYGARIS